MKNKWGLTIVLVSLAGMAAARGIKLCLEAESCVNCEAPMVVASNIIEGASGSYLEIPEGAGNPPKVVAGKAVYEFELPAAGLYTLWARVWWSDECGNSFTVRLNDLPPFTLGEDATYKRWHWVKYPLARTSAPLKLDGGRQTLSFHNREDGVHLDQILLTDDRRFVPVDIEPTGLRP